MTPGRGRLIVVGSAAVDLVAYVPTLPALGDDVVAVDHLVAAAGAYNVLAAAARHGMPAALLGRHGTGPNGDRIRTALRTTGITTLLPVTPDGDTGFCIGLVDGSGERTYVTVPGVDGALTEADLESVEIASDDVVYVSGYELAFPHAEAVTSWVERSAPSTTLVFDPGPLVASLPAGLLARVLARTSWCSVNAREARALTGAEPGEAGEELLRTHDGIRGVVTRAGGSGCWVATRSGGVLTTVSVRVPGGPREAVDTTGAGDCHVGTFIASLVEGFTPAEAAMRANAAAALAVIRRGPAAGPDRSVLDATLASTQR